MIIIVGQAWERDHIKGVVVRLGCAQLCMHYENMQISEGKGVRVESIQTP